MVLPFLTHWPIASTWLLVVYFLIYFKFFLEPLPNHFGCGWTRSDQVGPGCTRLDLVVRVKVRIVKQDGDGQQGLEEALVEVVVGIKSALTSHQFR